ncbi:MAG: hypothetical protein HYY16_06740, partial [Planctomycetes bacterium]|nr:hypothetical protein [Planctomycetota bacterium]
MRLALLIAVAVLWLAPAAYPDVVILDDGTVIECKIKEIKYPEPRVLSKFVDVAAVDEKGTIRQINSDEIKPDGSGVNRKAIFLMKTRWE